MSSLHNISNSENSSSTIHCIWVCCLEKAIASYYYKLKKKSPVNFSVKGSVLMSVRNHSDLLCYQTLCQIPDWREYSFSIESYEISFLCLFLSLFSAWARERFLQMELCWPQQATMVLSNSGRSILRGKMSQGNWRVRKWRISEQKTVFSLWELPCYRITCNGHSQGIITVEGEYL